MDLFSLESDQEAQDKEAQFLAAQNEQLASKSRNLLSVQRAIEGDKSYLQQMGEEPPPEPGRGWLPTLLDALDTPHQWVQGLIASATGTPGYEKLGPFAAAAKGSEEDLRAADILRRNHLLEKMPITRGIVGFFGDIVTDPLQWVTGIPQVAGVAGKAFGEETIPTLLKETGETPAAMFNRIKGAQFEKLSAAAALENPTNDARLAAVLNMQAAQKAETHARELFEGAQSYQRDLARFARSGANALVPEEVQKSLMEKAAKLGVGSKDETGLALADAADISKLYKKPTIRFTSPLMGVPGIEELPILGTREGDIPIVSDAVANAREALANGYYGAKLKTRNWITKSLAENTGAEIGKTQRVIAKSLDSIGRGADSVARMTNGALGYLSRRISTTGSAFGGRFMSNQIAQHERDRDALLQFVAMKGGAMAHDILPLEDSGEVLKHITNSIDATSDIFTSGLLEGGADLKRATVMEQLARRVSDPKKLEAAQKFTNFIMDDYARMGAKEKQWGLIDNVRDIYLPHIYKDLDHESANFALPRKYSSLAAARQTGLHPVDDALHLYIARRYAHELAFAQKDFMERMAFQHGLNPDVYNAITAQARQGVNELRAKDLFALRTMGVVNNADLRIPAMMLKGELVEGTENTFRGGRALDGETFDHYREIAANGDRDSKLWHDMLQQTSDLRAGQSIHQFLGFNVDEAGNAVLDATGKPTIVDNTMRERAQTMYQRYMDTQRSIPGYDGESTFARAGATTIAPFLKQRMLKDLTPGEETFWNNLIPSPLANALEESYYTGDMLKRWVAKNSAGQPKNDFVKAVDGTLSFLGKFNRVLKQGALSIWPARYVRDLTSAGFQAGLVMSPIEQVALAAKNLSQPALEAGHAAMDLGKYLNLHSLVQSHEVINGGKDLITPFGKISNQQLMMDAVKSGFEWNGNYATDAVATIGDSLAELAASPAMRANVPGIGRYAASGKELTAWEQAGKWAIAKSRLPLEDGLWQKIQGIPERLERYGRTTTFINLRSRGFDTEEAAALANRMHIDYRNAKTPFERKFLNNLFFFYSFSRGNASALTTALMKKPGALTTQLHAFHAVGEMLKDPNAYVDDPNIEEKIRSSRLAESMSMYLGRNEKTNLPQFLATSGLPVEDLAKFGAISIPTKLSSRDVIRAGAESAKRTFASGVSQANPLIKTAVEVLTGQNFYFNRPITDETLRKVPKWEKDTSILNGYPFRAVPQGVWHALDAVTKEVLDAKDNGDGTWTVNPYNLAVLNVIAPGITSLAPANPVIGALSPLKYSSRLLTTRKVLTEPGVNNRDKWLRLMTGVHVDEIDPDASRLYDEKKEIDEYMDFIGVPKGQRRRSQMMRAETEGDE